MKQRRQSKRGYRIQIGGKLGRHPQLGKEMKGIFAKEETMQAVERCVDYYMAHSESGERFGEVLNRRGTDDLLIYVKDSPERA